MKRLFNDMNSQLLVNKPVLWISAIQWILTLCFVIILLETIVGMGVHFAANLTVFYISALLVLVVLLFLWISFQYRNYDKIFSLRQTFRIYLYNIIAYVFICISSLVLVVIMSIRFNTLITAEGFSRDLLSLRIANLRDSDIEFIKLHPQLFTSIGSPSKITNPSLDTGKKIDYQPDGAVDLQTEYQDRQRLETNPLIKSNLSNQFSILPALRKMPGYEYVDSLMEAKYKGDLSFMYFEIDEDPLFYKYITSLSVAQLDSHRKHSKVVIRKYGLIPAGTDTSSAGIRSYYEELKDQVRYIETNSDVPKAHTFLTIILLMAICSITFNFILTKNILCLFTPFVYLTLLALTMVLVYSVAKQLGNMSSTDFRAALLANIFLAGLLIIAMRWRHRIHNRNLLFFMRQMQNLSALAFFVILLIYATDADISGAWSIPLFIFSVAGFLITHYFFIRKMHHTLIQEI